MSGTSFRTVAEVTLILFEDTVEFFISRSIPTGNIVHLFATDASVTATDTNNAQTWKLSKVYTTATTRPDVIYVRVTCSNGSIPTPPFFTVAYTYNVTVVDARFSPPTRELVMLTNAHDTTNVRAMEYFYDLPSNVGVISIVPSSSDEPNPSSTFVDELTNERRADLSYGSPAISVVPNGPGKYRLRILQNFSAAGTNTMLVTLLFNRYNAYRTYAFTYVCIRVGDLRINGYAAAPFLIDLLSYDNGNQTNVSARYIHRSLTAGSNLVLNNDATIHSALGTSTTILPATTYYGTSVSAAVDTLVSAMKYFPLVSCRRQNDFVYFELDNRSTVALYEFGVQRSITFDNGAIVRCDPLINKLFGIVSEQNYSSEDVITGLQTIKGQRVFTRVVPPVISLELETIANQQEGVVRQSESVRLFNFLMLDDSSGYKMFDNQKQYPHRVIQPNSTRIKILRFHFVYNRMAEVQNIDTNGIPLQFLEPYYVTIRFQFRVPKPASAGGADYDVMDSYITLTGTNSMYEFVLESPVSGIQLVELVEARLPMQAEAVATANGRRAILGYVVDKALYDPLTTGEG